MKKLSLSIMVLSFLPFLAFSQDASRNKFIGQKKELTNQNFTTQNSNLNLSSLSGSTLLFEDFEGQLAPSFKTGGSGGNWSLTNQNGNQVAQSGTGIPNSVSYLEYNVISPNQGGTISFSFKVSSESDTSFLRFYIDGIQQNQWSGNVKWTTNTFQINGGSHNLKWTYEKVGVISSSLDRVYIDDVLITSNSSALRVADDGWD